MNNRYIQQEADDLLKGTLRKLFQKRNFKLGEFEANEKYERGIDYFFEVTNDKGQHVLFFFNQNKGTMVCQKPIVKSNHSSQGQIPFQISLRHAEYFFYELKEPLIFTICDLESKKVFWYDIQNDLSLEERIISQRKKGTKFMQIYIPFQNVLNEDTFEEFIDKVKYANYTQIRKKKIISSNLKIDYSIVEKETEGKQIIDKLYYVIKLFEGFIVLPTYVICRLYPFKGTQAKTYINAFNLYTDNADFFDLLDNIILKDNVLCLKSNEVLVENQNEKLEEIIGFLIANNLYHIVWRGNKTKNQICVHKLYQSVQCDCERCNVERLDFSTAFSILNNKLSLSSEYEKLRRGYTFYLLGDYKKASTCFLEVHLKANQRTNPINYTISTYNLSKLYRLINATYYEVDRKELLDKLSNIDFNIDEPFINRHAPLFLDVYRDIEGSLFYEDAKNAIDRCYIEIQKISFNDKYGAFYSNNRFTELEFEFLRLQNYLKHNLIIFNHYVEYDELLKKVLESVIALYSLKNPITDKYQEFEWNILEICVFNIDIAYLQYLLKKYDVKKIKVHPEEKVPDLLGELLDNLIRSSKNLDDLNAFEKPINIERILNRVIFITSLLDVDFTAKRKIIISILGLFDIFENKNKIPFDSLFKFVVNNQNEIDASLVKSIIELFVLTGKNAFYLEELISVYAKKCSPEELELLVFTILKISDLDSMEVDFDNSFFNDFIYSFNFLKGETKEKLVRGILNKLKFNFNKEVYYLISINDLIGYDKDLFNKFILSISDKSYSRETDLFFRTNDNSDLGDIINLIFKYDLEINDELKKIVKLSHSDYYDYYCWLLDLDNFDYSKFQLYWILKYQTIFYFNKFKQSERLKLELSERLKNEYIEGVAKIYFQHLV